MSAPWLLPLLALGLPTSFGLWILYRARIPYADERTLRAFSLASVILTPLAVLLLYTFEGALQLKIAPQMTIHLAIDPTGTLFVGVASVLWILTVVYSLGYMPPGKPGNGRFFGYLVMAQGAVVGIALAQNLLTLYVFYEALTLATYPLVTHKGTPPAITAGRTYITYSLGGAALVLAGMVGLQSMHGDLVFLPGGFLSGQAGSVPPLFFFALVLGFGVKAALMPFHGWLPRAMIAPTPVSALLHAVAVVKAGVFGVLRVVYGVFGIDILQDLGVAQTISALALVTILLASVLALRQDVLKKRLAYSTVAQLSYIVLGISLLSPLGLTGAMIHLVNHALLKVVLFFAVGVIANETGVDRLSQMAGMGRRLPLTMGAFTLASLGLIGVLPTNGFWGKWHLITGSIEAGHILPALTLIVSALAAGLYLLPISMKAFLEAGDTEAPAGAEAPASMVYPVLALTGFAMVLGVHPAPLVRLAAWVAGSMLGGDWMMTGW